jgi:glycosyltransferase involved in cell wall biosynthesis
MTPRVSVVMSVHNGEKYLEEAIESILHQTFSDFEFIIIDDGSNDSTPGLLARQAALDPRILIHRFDNNRGISTALNFGIRLARGEYIARMDSDDISVPNRLYEQVTFMDSHPDITICGTWVKLIGDIKGEVWKYPVEHEMIHASMLFSNTLVHPTVMMRSVSIKQHALLYDERIRYAQDYELWSRAVTRVQLANLNQVLVHYRIHAQSIDSKNYQEQVQTHEMIYRRLLKPLNITFTPENLSLHQQIGTYQYGNDIEFLRRARRWLVDLSPANRKVKLIRHKVMNAELGLRWTQACEYSQAHPLRLCFEILTSPLPFYQRTGFPKFLRGMVFSLGRIASDKDHVSH